MIHVLRATCDEIHVLRATCDEIHVLRATCYVPRDPDASGGSNAERESKELVGEIQPLRYRSAVMSRPVEWWRHRSRTAASEPFVNSAIARMLRRGVIGRRRATSAVRELLNVEWGFA